ncbi:hypothetical protein H4582DRAFT_2077190 [Lactarius indigo]|nr:hypothetical protein H4582DRAFT_2077190 [Lactarius indigo]
MRVPAQSPPDSRIRVAPLSRSYHISAPSHRGYFRKSSTPSTSAYLQPARIWREPVYVNREGLESRGNITAPPSWRQITLYGITGYIVGLFVVVVITDIIRVIRHPERYRAAAGSGGAGGPAPPGRGDMLCDQDLEAYGNRPPPTPEMQDIQNDVPASA